MEGNTALTGLGTLSPIEYERHHAETGLAG